MTERDRVVRCEDDPWNLDASKNYSQDELEVLASKILYEDRARLRAEKLGETAQKILLFLLKHEYGTPVQIAGAIAINETAVRKNLQKMIDEGWVEFSHQEKSLQYFRIVEDIELPEGADCPKWLNEAELRGDKQKEIYSQTGKVDPSIEEGIFDRSHPQGKVY